MARRILVLLALILLVVPARSEVELTLRPEFIEINKNRVTISTQFRVDAVKKTINSPTKDGDLHIAGRPGPEIGLVTVAEIQNARTAPEGVGFFRSKIGEGPVEVTGVWRIWFEHAGGGEHEQGEPMQPTTNTNPDHVFEIHPVTKVGNISLLDTLKPIEGYTAPENVETRIRMLESMRGSIQIGTQKVTIRAGGNSPNYIRFVMKMLPGNHGFQRSDGTWTQPSDGKFIFAKIYDLEAEELLVRKRRIAFVAGSEPFQKVANMQPNECLSLLGITRVNLELISWRVRNANKRPEVLTWNLPYELVAVGAHGDVHKCAEDEDE